MPGIAASGIGSGLDVQSIVAQLMEIERQPLQRLQVKQSQLEAQISAYGQLRSTLSTFQTAMDELSTLDALKVYTTTTANENVLDLTATSSASIGSYNIEVVRTAQQHKMISDEILKTTTFGGTAGDSISIQVGADVADTITVDMTTAMTLNDIRDAINDDINNPGVQASVINGDNDMQKLVFTASESGANSALTLSYGGSVNAGSFNLQTLNDIAGDTSQLNAEINVDGYNITRSSNNIADVISGVTINLHAANPGTAYTVSVGRDLETVEANVQTFAEAFNELRNAIKDYRGGQLEADSSLLSIDRSLMSIINSPAANGTFSVLSEIGLTMQKDGNMTLSSSDLQAALQSDFEGVAQLFADDTEGFAKRFADLVDSWLTTDGLLDTRTDGLESRVDDLLDRQAAFERNLEAVEARYRAQFSSLDALVGQLQGTGQFLTSQLAQLPGANGG